MFVGKIVQSTHKTIAVAEPVLQKSTQNERH